jgi:cobalt-zinc-cadmium efflux system outer membrane protein
VATLLAACATVRPDAAMPKVRDAVGERTGATAVWQQDRSADQPVQDAVARLLQRDLTVESAVQIALLNNPRLQARYQALGIAQADLVEAGLPENPVLGVSALFGDAGSIVEGGLMQ